MYPNELKQQAAQARSLGGVSGACGASIGMQASQLNTCEATRRSEIDRELSRLAQATAELQACADQLWNRLAPVLSPVPPSPSETCPQECCTSDLGGALQRQANAVDQTTASLRNAMAALAL
jgi:hypothetical protein